MGLLVQNFIREGHMNGGYMDGGNMTGLVWAAYLRLWGLLRWTAYAS